MNATENEKRYEKDPSPIRHNGSCSDVSSHMEENVDIVADNSTPRQAHSLLYFLPPEGVSISSSPSDSHLLLAPSLPQHLQYGSFLSSMDSGQRNQRQYQEKKQQEQQFARSRGTLTFCVLLLIVVLLCGPLIMWPSKLDCSTLQTRRMGRRACFEPTKTNPVTLQDTTFDSNDSSDSNGSLPPPLKSFAKRSGTLHVLGSRPYFPSYLDYVDQDKPIEVTYDSRSLRFNDQPVLLLGGSMHPTRAASLEEWEQALDQAVRNGLNLITVYVFWSAHQPFMDQEMDWSLPYSRRIQNNSYSQRPWEWADAIRACAERGIFVHLRLGPYTCAEYSYGGLPEWLGVKYPNIRMRRMDPDWLQLMEHYVAEFTAYMSLNRLWAYQGGNIVLAQIENELGQETNVGFMEDKSHSFPVDQEEDDVQAYADWCGEMVRRVASRKIVWTMCNGLSANNTIESLNTDWSSLPWLDHHGDNGRIQIDQPALWTEDEQGFQVWGETPQNPIDYFWGISARAVARNALRWIARGGRHVNYYMWWGGYNRGRTAAAGILNAYATDAMLCPSGEPRQPKFGHLTFMHQSLAMLAPILLQTTNLPQQQVLESKNETNGEWATNEDQLAFIYTLSNHSPSEVVFVENNGLESVTVRVASNFTLLSSEPTSFPYAKKPSKSSTSGQKFLMLQLQPESVVILVDGDIAFESATISPQASSFERTTLTDFVSLLDWKSLREPPLSISSSLQCQAPSSLSTHPVEQTKLHHGIEQTWSDYAWYSTQFTLVNEIETATLLVDTDKAMVISIYLDGLFLGVSENHEHKEGQVTFAIPMGSTISHGRHELSILSESLGYHNLIGRWGSNVGAKQKGIIGNVALSLSKEGKNISLTGTETAWCSVGSLLGEQLGLSTPKRNNELFWERLGHSFSKMDGPLWTISYFDTPTFGSDQRLFLRITKGRGHLWINGHDLGRFWNITRSPNEEDTTNYSQSYYYLPRDYLTTGGKLNELVLFNAMGDTFGDQSIQLVLSWTDASAYHSFLDEVGFAESCLV